MEKENKFIVCTTGPALNSTKQIINAFNLGCSNFRIPLSKLERDHLGCIENIYAAQAKLISPLNILLDLPTERLRIGKIENIMFTKGQVVFFCDPGEIDKKTNMDCKCIVPVLNLCNHIKDMNIGDKVLLKDGQIEFLITNKSRHLNEITAICLNSSVICDAYSSFSIEGKSFKYRLLRNYDEELILLLFQKGILPNWIILSFTNDSDDVQEIRSFFNSQYRKNIKVMAKVETQNGINNIQNIASEADGILIGRGDLCNDIYPSDLPSAQKYIQEVASQNHCPVIVGTQFLQKFASTGNLSVTEIVDIYLTICQADGIMLSGESGGSHRSADCINFLNETIKKYTRAETKRMCL